jgi:SNF2 family DNA or RNA helicase
MPKALPLKEYQRRAFDFAIANPYSILALEMGLGKSLVSIAVRESLGGNCLVICPSYLVTNWVAEIRKWVGDGPIITTIKKGSEVYDIVDSDYVITSYDLCQRSEQLFEWADMVILDECHLLKSMSSKRASFIHRVIYENSIKRVHLLTGTPIKNRTQEFYSLLALCNYSPHTPDSQFLNSYPDEISFADKFSYRDEYTILVRGRRVTILKWSGLKNVEELKIYLEGKYLRIKSSDVLDLPPIVFKNVVVGSKPDHKLLEAFKEYMAVDSSRIDPTVKAVSALEKTPQTIKYVLDLIEQTGCALVYTDHVLASEVLAKGLETVPINGNMSAHKRMEMAQRFQSGEGNVLVATVGALSTGVNLTRSSHIVMNDLPWVPGDLQQVIYRIQRIGQEKPCFVHRIFSGPTDEYIAEVLLSKQDTIDKAT